MSATAAICLMIEQDNELRYCKPGETQTERLLRAVDELRDELAAAADEWRSVDERAYEAERKLDDLRGTVRTFLHRMDWALEDESYTGEGDDTLRATAERIVTDFEQELGA